MLKLGALIISICLFTNQTFAAGGVFPVKARLFAGILSADPSDVNTEQSAQGLKEVDDISALGAEAVFSFAKLFDGGFRYTKRYIKSEEEPANAATDYSSTIDQDSVSAIGRVPFISTNLLRMDIFAGVGGAKTSLKMKTAAQDGELTKSMSLLTQYGASVAFGYKKVFFVIEGGYEGNKVDSLEKTGTMNGNISTIDLSGPYISVGILFDSVASKAK